jgi:hypothetical protein
MEVMNNSGKNKIVSRYLSLGSIALVTLAFTVGCSNDAPEATQSQDSQTAIPSISSEPTGIPNEIDKDAEATYREAILASQVSASLNGLTELWYDSENELVQVSVQTKDGSQFITQDFLDGSVYEVDESAMMPAMLLAELDALAVSGTDFGYVVFDDQKRIEVSNNIDDIVYVTTYEIGQDGLIYKATITAEDEALGVITYTYSITKEGQDALDVL